MIGAVGMGALSSRFGLPMIFIGSAALLFMNNIWMKFTFFNKKEKSSLSDGC